MTRIRREIDPMTAPMIAPLILGVVPPGELMEVEVSALPESGMLFVVLGSRVDVVVRVNVCVGDDVASSSGLKTVLEVIVVPVDTLGAVIEVDVGSLLWKLCEGDISDIYFQSTRSLQQKQQRNTPLSSLQSWESSNSLRVLGRFFIIVQTR